MSDRRQAGVMLIPAPLPCLPETAHLTVVYAGEDATDQLINELCTATVLLARRVDAFSARCLGVNYQFGDNKDEPVILLGITPQLVMLRGPLARYSKSSYSEFRPHMATPDIRDYFAHGWHMPHDFYFNRIQVWLDSEPEIDVYLGTGTPA